MKRRTLLDTHPRTILFGLLSVSSLVATAWFAVEEALLVRDERPITFYARDTVNRHLKVAYTIGAAFAFVAGVALCHFIIDSDQEPVHGRAYQPSTLEVP